MQKLTFWESSVSAVPGSGVVLYRLKINSWIVPWVFSRRLLAENRNKIWHGGSSSRLMHVDRALWGHAPRPLSQPRSCKPRTTSSLGSFGPCCRSPAATPGTYAFDYTSNSLTLARHEKEILFQKSFPKIVENRCLCLKKLLASLYFQMTFFKTWRLMGDESMFMAKPKILSSLFFLP